MLYYFITVTSDLIVVAILIGLLYAYVPEVIGARGRRLLTAGVLVGTVAAAVMAILRNTTKILDRSGGTGMWNVRIFVLSTAALLIYYIFSTARIRRKAGRGGEMAAAISAAVLIFTFLVYALPGVMAYPANFSLADESIFSTDFMYRLIGYLMGLTLCLLVCLATWRTVRAVKSKTAAILVNIALFINGFWQVTKALQVLHARRTITGSAVFTLVRYTSNYSDLFIYAIMLVAFVAAVVLWVRSFQVNEPYENPAQHRKIRAKWRSIRRWSALLSVCFGLCVLNLTVFTALENQEVELSPVEDCEVQGDYVYVPLTQLDDGHLHRFGYTTEGGTQIRFIIIKKPNSSAYGIGLDACEICGETGYYERNEQVICNLCDVVININTIGFKGGCNPIVIEYSIEDGYIVIPVDGLVENEKMFE